MEAGYCHLATLMSRSPETAIFRGFKMLNAQNLLYLQAELTELELELKALRERDRSMTHPNCQRYHKNWYLLSRSKRDGDGEQWAKALEIRTKLQEYSAFDLYTSQVNFVTLY